MVSNMALNTYIKELNKLNAEHGLVVKYDPEVGEYIIEDQVNFDYVYVKMVADPLDDYKMHIELSNMVPNKK